MRISGRLASWIVLVALMTLALVPTTAVVAHDGSIQHLAREHFHTKSAANARFVTERWAVVDSDGTLLRGEKVISSTRQSEGFYLVKFNRDVTHCAFSVTPSAENGSIPFRSASASTGGWFPGDLVGVGVFDLAGAYLDNGFSLVLTC